MRGLLAGVAALALAQTAMAADLPQQTLRAPSQTVRWSGKSLDQTGQGYGPPVEESCTTDTCDTLTLKVDLPPGTFPKGPLSPAPAGTQRMQAEGPTDLPGDGVLIAVKWATDFDQWNLFVDDVSTGQTVARAIDLDSNAQSVLLSRPHNGLYRIRVVPFYTDFDKRDLTYRGTAQVFRDPLQRVPSGRRILPQIQTVAPANFHIAD